MNVYVESNFVLELVFQQEQYASCEEILKHCAEGAPRLVIPAFCLTEPLEKLKRQSVVRNELHQKLELEFRQLERTALYSDRMTHLRDAASVLIRSSEEELKRFVRYRERLLQWAEVIPLTHVLLQSASVYEAGFDLSPQDALVYASVIHHIQERKPEQGCFLNKNSRDFYIPGIVDELALHDCRMIPRFNDGLNFIRSQMPR